MYLVDAPLVAVSLDGFQTIRPGMLMVHLGSLEFLDELKVYMHVGGGGEGVVRLATIENSHNITVTLKDWLDKDLPDEMLDGERLDQTVEHYADRVHELWMHWATAIMAEESISKARRERWKSYMVPYEDLPEHAKDMDRKEARFLLGVRDE